MLNPRAPCSEDILGHRDVWWGWGILIRTFKKTTLCWDVVLNPHVLAFAGHGKFQSRKLFPQQPPSKLNLPQLRFP